MLLCVLSRCVNFVVVVVRLSFLLGGDTVSIILRCFAVSVLLDSYAASVRLGSSAVSVRLGYAMSTLPSSYVCQFFWVASLQILLL